MLNKILVWGGLALTAILIIENIVGGNQAYLFIDKNSYAWVLALVSTVIWACIWFGWKSMLEERWYDNADDDLQF